MFYVQDLTFFIRRVWKHQRGNQIPYIEEEQTTQWSKEKRSTKHTYKTKDRVITLFAWLYVGIDILLTCEMNFHDCITELRERRCGRNGPVPVPGKKNGVFASFYDLVIWFWNCSDSVVFVLYHFIIYFSIS